MPNSRSTPCRYWTAPRTASPAGSQLTATGQPASQAGPKDQAGVIDHPRYPLLFDLQTAGGLLASAPAGEAESCPASLKAAGYHASAVIGRILPQGDALAPISIKR
ncbi:hypothetical protein ACU8V3_15035 [Cobetia marina]